MDSMTLGTSKAHPSIPSTRVRIASSLAWLAGSYSVVVSASMVILEASASRPVPALFVANGAFGIVCCLTGFLLRKRHKAGALLAIPLCLLTGLGFAWSGRLLTITFVLTTVGLVLVLVSWREFNWKAAA